MSLTLQHVFLIIHIAMVVAAFGTGFTHASLMRVVKAGGPGAKDAADVSLTITKQYTIPALLFAVLAGVALVLNSNNAYSFSDTWISASFSAVLLLLLLAWFLILPAQKSMIAALKAGNSAEHEVSRLSMTTGMYHLGFLIILVLMVWKP